ncbi:MAG: SH3 domain-containing protein, partial [Lachnospiraceae bacterium]|nr:SH3 domain-containing protein [Lachnospiraceae bacterium]
MKKIIPMLVAIVLILIVGGVYLGPEIMERYSYSQEEADLEEYFDVRDSDDVPIILNHEPIEEHARLFDSHCYMRSEDVDTLLNGRFYIGKADNSLIYTTPTDVITAEIGSGKWESTDGHSGEENYRIAFYEDETLYICLDYVRKFTDFTSDLYSDPNRLVMATVWESEERTRITRKTAVRVRGGIKSEILCEVNKNAAVRVVEEMENWSKIQTDDGFAGYVENKRLGDKVEYTPDHVSEVKEEEYTSISKPYMINMAWHLIMSKEGNSTFSELVAATNAGEKNGFNTIAPTWYQLCDGEGNIVNNASSEYVKEAHKLGIEVWGVVDNFNNENADTAKALATRENRQRLIDHLVDVSLEIGADGINVDFEQVPASSGEDFVEFLRELSIPCRKNSLVLSVDNYVPMGALNDHYDRKEHGVVADYFVVMR